MNVTVCGSGTGEGLYHVTLSPTLTWTLWGEKVSHAAPAPPDATLVIFVGLAVSVEDKSMLLPVPITRISAAGTIATINKTFLNINVRARTSEYKRYCYSV
jgi:hypothetical protein